MVQQYIGARYTIKVYENSLDPSSAEWEASTAYEPLTLVTFNNSSYLSKKQVPNTIGDPAANPSYWVQTGYYNGQIAQLQNDVSDLQPLLDNFVDIRDYGAVLDGVTDDSDAFEAALVDGNVLLPHNSTIHLHNTVHVPSNRMIYGNWSSITADSGIAAFTIHNVDLVSQTVWCTIQDLFIYCDNGNNGIDIRDAYGILIKNVRIHRLQANAHGIDITDCFNVTVDNCWIHGSVGGDGYASGATGIILATANTNISADTNITNIAFTNCLIQRVENGLRFYRKDAIGYAEVIDIQNIGFSYCDIALNIDDTHINEVIVEGIRVESTNLVIHNRAQNSKYTDISGYHCAYVMENDQNGVTLGNVYINNTGFGTGYIIKNNTGGRIIVDGYRLGGISMAECDDFTKIGSIIPSDTLVSIQTVNANTQFAVSQFYESIINFNGNNDITNCTRTSEGTRFKFIVSSGTFTCGSFTYTNDGTFHEAIRINNSWHIN